MFAKTITYTDFNGTERKELFYFNLSEDELIEMEVGTNGGFADVLTRIIEAKDQPTLIKEFKKFILKAYGEKSPDGRRFMKSEEISKAFSETPAYTKLFMELAFNDKAAAEFINKLIPEDIHEKVMAHIEASKNDKPQLEAVDANLAN